MTSSNEYRWKFRTIGGVTRVCIENGNDIAHLDELDQKLWTVLSCPVEGLELDSKTLKLLDTDNDGRIHVNEVISAGKWLTSVLRYPDKLFDHEDRIALDDFDASDPEGLKLLNSAKHILANLGKSGSGSISVADTSDSVAIFASTALNGDGIITEASTKDASLLSVIKDVMASVGSVMDRSGKMGVNAEFVEKFYAECKDYSSWKKAATGDILPFGDNTAPALVAMDRIASKVEDFFMRCKLAAFSTTSAALLNVSEARITSISERNLNDCRDEIAGYPIAQVNPECRLSLSNGLNPLWKEAVDEFRALVGLDVLDEDAWKALKVKFAPYRAYLAAKKGQVVENLGIERVNSVLEEDRMQELLDIVAADEALRGESESIDAVDKLLHFYRDYATFLANFVTFSDFYSVNDGKKAIFQAGTLYVDQRNCDLCIKVNDMAKHGDMAGLSGMFLIYCDCVSKSKAEKMSIVAVMTEGSVSRLRVGSNALFYDRQGNDWDATVTKIVDNPISVKQAFWSPYRKLGAFFEDMLAKMASDKDVKVTAELTSKVESTATMSPQEQKEAAKQPFDIAKFAGVFAAIGLALGALGTALATIFGKFLELNWWQMIVVVIAIMLIISGPAMLSAALKLRKRNLAPVLNANGWAINSNVLVNTIFGAKLTSVANLPVSVGFKDPYETGHSSRNLLLAALLVIVVTVAAFFLFKHYAGDDLDGQKLDQTEEVLE